MTSDRFVTVAWVYDQGELGLLLSLFEWEDIWVVPLGWFHAATDQYFTAGIGGIRLRVHEEDAPRALALLAGLEWTPQTSVRFLFRNKLADLLLIVLLLLLNAAPPARVQAEFAVARRERVA